MNKDTILFYLRRRIHELESAVPDHVAMAQHGQSYAARAAAVKQAEDNNAQNRTEIEAISEAIALVEKHG